MIATAAILTATQRYGIPLICSGVNPGEPLPAFSAFRISATQLSVRLARQQARSAAEMHAQLAELAPGLLSAFDVRRGNAMAALRAAQRRLVYLYLGRRMRAVRPA